MDREALVALFNVAASVASPVTCNLPPDIWHVRVYVRIRSPRASQLVHGCPSCSPNGLTELVSLLYTVAPTGSGSCTSS